MNCKDDPRSSPIVSGAWSDGRAEYERVMAAIGLHRHEPWGDKNRNGAGAEASRAVSV